MRSEGALGMRCNCQGVIPRGQVYTWPIGPSWTTSSERVAVLEDSADIRGMCVKICELLCVAGWICVWEPVCWGWGRVVRSLEAKLMLIEENTRSSDLVPVTVGCQRVLFTLR